MKRTLFISSVEPGIAAARGLVAVVALLTIANVYLLLPAYSQVVRQLPETGMSAAAVTRMWGSPVARREYEILREEIWLYNEAEIRFREGKVVDWKPLPGSKLEEKAELVEPRKPSEPQLIESETSVEDILSEIMREAPQP